MIENPNTRYDFQNDFIPGLNSVSFEIYIQIQHKQYEFANFNVRIAIKVSFIKLFMNQSFKRPTTRIGVKKDVKKAVLLNLE